MAKKPEPQNGPAQNGVARELSEYAEAIKKCRASLSEFASAATAHTGLHFIPALTDGRAHVNVINFKDGKVLSVEMDSVAAGFFYEAQRALLPQVFAKAEELAEASKAVVAAQVKDRLAAERKALEDAEKALAGYAT